MKIIAIAIYVGDCEKLGRESYPKECPYGGTHNGTYGVVVFEKGERSRAVRSYVDVTRGNV